MTIFYLFFAVIFVIAMKKPIEMLSGILWPWIAQKKRERRLRKQKPPTANQQQET